MRMMKKMRRKKRKKSFFLLRGQRLGLLFEALWR
jgi:hypothetical protein